MIYFIFYRKDEKGAKKIPEASRKNTFAFFAPSR